MKTIKLFFPKTIIFVAAITVMSILPPCSSYAAIGYTTVTVSNLLPNLGLFTSSNSTVGWSFDTSAEGTLNGGGSFNWYPLSGFVGLSCNPGQSIKLQTYNPSSTLWSIISLDTMVRDEIKIRAHIRANPSVSNGTLAGMFWMTAQGALALDTY